MGVPRSFALRCQIPERRPSLATVGCNPTTNLRRQLKPLIRNALRSFGLGSTGLRLSLIWKSFQLMDIPAESVPEGKETRMQARMGCYGRATSRNENFVLVLEGISRAKPLASRSIPK